MQALVEEGKIKYVGLSEVSADDLRKAHDVHPVTAVQLEWSLWTRDAEVGQKSPPPFPPPCFFPPNARASLLLLLMLACPFMLLW